MKKLLSVAIIFSLIQNIFAQNSPVAVNDTFSINKNNQVTFPVLSNDYDVDGDSLSVSILNSPVHGAAVVAGNQIVYQPNQNYVGSDSLSYVICDTTGRCDTAWVFIAINNINNPPVAMNDTFTIPENQLSILPVLSNDYEPDGDALTVTIIVGPSKGTASVNNNNEVAYTPSQFYFGIDSFIYVACDLAGLCDTATVYITINGANMPPVANNDQFTFSDSLHSTSLDVLVNDTDPEGGTLTILSALDNDSSNYLGNLTVDSSSGQLIFMRNGISCGTETFGYLVCDYNSCDTGYFTLTIICPDHVFLPEGFSPDGDGINDKLVFTALEHFEPAHLKVFNRYGNLVFESEDYQNDWTGTLLQSNKALPDGTYFYVLEFSDKRKYNNYLVINR